jgi:NAD(P)-dependent dehydrogenase (short-subunit alcohol dehydrogenase family)
MDLELASKRAIVTGGSRGIGKAIARELAREGARVAITARDRRALDETAAQLEHETGAQLLAVECDLGRDESVWTMVDRVVANFGAVDILVNCAAKSHAAVPEPPLAATTEDYLWPDWNVKIVGYLRCVRAVVPHMAPGSRIINISGLATRTASSIAGSVRNAGVVALTKVLADQLGGQGISVLCVHPSLTRTESFGEVLRAQAERAGVTEDEIERRIARDINVLGRVIDAQEVAYVITFLASSRAIAVNGDVVAAGGGWPGSIHY